MPYSRPSLSDLRALAAQDIAAALPGTDPLLRFAVLGILGRVVAGMSNLHYGYLDWIARQAVPSTSSDEYLAAWGALKNVYLKGPKQASGSITFTATDGSPVPSGTAITRSDGVGYTTTASATASGTSVTVQAQADDDPTGLSGAFGNADAGTQFSLAAPIPGVSSSGIASTAFTGGADLETQDSFQARVIEAYQNPPAGGSSGDYATWALSVSGVTRAWPVPGLMGPGTVGIYVMLDNANASFGGFPQGTNGAATSELRAAAATGDQLAVANAIYPLRPITDVVYVLAPLQLVVPFTISGLSAASAATKSAVSAAIAGVFAAAAQPGSLLPLSLIEAAVAQVAGTSGFVIQSPSANIPVPAGSLPVLGAVSYV
jgi:uncharacterized phage protein gp47/JayE